MLKIEIKEQACDSKFKSHETHCSLTGSLSLVQEIINLQIPFLEVNRFLTSKNERKQKDVKGPKMWKLIMKINLWANFSLSRALTYRTRSWWIPSAQSWILFRLLTLHQKRAGTINEGKKRFQAGWLLVSGLINRSASDKVFVTCQWNLGIPANPLKTLAIAGRFLSWRIKGFMKSKNCYTSVSFNPRNPCLYWSNSRCRENAVGT